MKKITLVMSLFLITSTVGFSQSKKETTATKVSTSQTNPISNWSQEECEQHLKNIEEKKAYFNEHPEEKKQAESEGWFEKMAEEKKQVEARLEELQGTKSKR